MRFLKALLLVAVFTCALLFFIQNSKALESTITLSFNLYYGDLVWTAKPLPYFVIILAAFVVGVVVSALYLLMERIRLGCAVLKYKNDLRGREKELASLREKMDKEAKTLEVQGNAKAKELPAAQSAA